MLRVVEYLYQNRDKDTLLHSALKQSFKIKDNKKLLVLSCEYIQFLDNLSNYTDDEDVKKIIKDIQKIFISTNLEKPIKTFNKYLTLGHFSTLKMLYEMVKNKDEFKISADIKTLLTQLKEFDTDIAIKLIEILEEFDIEFKLIGNRAYEKLYIKLMGIIILYKDEIKNSSNNFKNIVNNLLNKVTFATKIIKTIKELSFESKNLIEIIGDYNG